jgi:hypothetical protein
MEEFQEIMGLLALFGPMFRQMSDSVSNWNPLLILYAFYALMKDNAVDYATDYVNNWFDKREANGGNIKRSEMTMLIKTSAEYKHLFAVEMTIILPIGVLLVLVSIWTKSWRVFRATIGFTFACVVVPIVVHQIIIACMWPLWWHMVTAVVVCIVYLCLVWWIYKSLPPGTRVMIREYGKKMREYDTAIRNCQETQAQTNEKVEELRTAVVQLSADNEVVKADNARLMAKLQELQNNHA